LFISGHFVKGGAIKVKNLIEFFVIFFKPLFGKLKETIKALLMRLI